LWTEVHQAAEPSIGVVFPRNVDGPTFVSVRDGNIAYFEDEQEATVFLVAEAIATVALGTIPAFVDSAALHEVSEKSARETVVKFRGERGRG
jgi:hypothetical protein